MFCTYVNTVDCFVLTFYCLESLLFYELLWLVYFGQFTVGQATVLGYILVWTGYYLLFKVLDIYLLDRKRNFSFVFCFLQFNCLCSSGSSLLDRILLDG